MRDDPYAAVLMIGRFSPRVVRLRLADRSLSIDNGEPPPTVYRQPTLSPGRRAGLIRITSVADGELRAVVLADDEPSRSLRPGMLVMTGPAVMAGGGMALFGIVSFVFGVSGKEARQVRAGRRLAASRLIDGAAGHGITVRR